MSSGSLRPILAATVLSALMMTGAMAQTTPSTGQMPTPPADRMPASDSTSNKRTTTGSSDAANPRTPGATGTTIVPGNNSSVAGDADATRRQQTTPSSSGR